MVCTWRIAVARRASCAVACAVQHAHCKRSLARRRLRAWQAAVARGSAAHQLAAVAAGRSSQLHALLGRRKARAAMTAWRGGAEEARRRRAVAAAAHVTLAPMRSGVAFALVRWRRHAEWRDAIASRDGAVRAQARDDTVGPLLYMGVRPLALIRTMATLTAAVYLLWGRL